MVKLKKQISIILILSLFLSLIPNFLYTREKGVFATDNPCQNVSCPPGCPEPEYDKKTDSCSCINCPIPCEIGAKTFTNKSCLPLEGTGEWTCGVEIPVGEVMDRTAYLAGRMLAEFGGMIANGRQMADKADEILNDYKKWNCHCEDDASQCIGCQTDCDKYYSITKGVLQIEGSDPKCSECPECIDYNPEDFQESAGGTRVTPSEECLKCQDSDTCHQECKECSDFCQENKENCCWLENKEIKLPDPKNPGKTIEKTIACKYCKKEGSDPDTGEPYCREICSPYSCWGCCWSYFWPILNGYTEIENLQKALKNDIEEKTPEGEDLPENFKFKRSYILEQLDFSRCELAQCWIPAEEYYDVLSGKKVGKHLLTCETVTQMDLFDNDQINCSSYQIENEWETIIEIWKEPKEHWWQWLVVPFKTILYVLLLPWRTIWDMIKEWADTGQEEGCYPTNYYCCQM